MFFVYFSFAFSADCRRISTQPEISSGKLPREKLNNSFFVKILIEDMLKKKIKEERRSKKNYNNNRQGKRITKKNTNN